MNKSEAYDKLEAYLKKYDLYDNEQIKESLDMPEDIYEMIEWIELKEASEGVIVEYW